MKVQDDNEVHTERFVLTRYDPYTIAICGEIGHRYRQIIRQEGQSFERNFTELFCTRCGETVSVCISRYSTT